MSPAHVSGAVDGVFGTGTAHTRGLLVHEWIAPSGGSENVLEEMARAFPDADVRCLWSDAPHRLADRRVTETWLARTPVRRSKALAAPFSLMAWRTLPRADYDWMLVSSHLFAHHARVRGRDGTVPKFVYVHSPARYIWTPEHDPRGQGRAVRAVAPLFRAIDRRRAAEPVALAANSAFIRDRIRSAWRRDAVVIHPPVAVDRLTDVARWQQQVTDDEKAALAALPTPFVLGVSRFISYKRLDLVIAAAEAAGVPAVLAGRGPEAERLARLAAAARVPVEIVSSPSDAMLWSLYHRAAALVFPAVEDFGIVPVEAQALGTPVVTGPVGGQTETFVDGLSGIVSPSLDPADLGDAVTRALRLPAFDGAAITARFSAAVFHDRIRAFVSAAH